MFPPYLQVSELRALLQGEEEEEEEEEEEGEGGVKAPEEMMVFEADDEKQPAYEPPPKKEVSFESCVFVDALRVDSRCRRWQRQSDACVGRSTPSRGCALPVLCVDATTTTAAFTSHLTACALVMFVRASCDAFRVKSKRSFMADDGTKFAWDEEKGDWKEVEGDEEEELEEEEEVSESALQLRVVVDGGAVLSSLVSGSLGICCCCCCC